MKPVDVLLAIGVAIINIRPIAMSKRAIARSQIVGKSLDTHKQKIHGCP